MDIQTKDGILLRNVPDGTPDEVIQARIAKIRGGNSPEAQPQSKLNLNQEPPTTIESVIAKYAPSWMADSRATRGILQGAADPAVGLTQLAANSPAGSLLGADKVVNQFVNDKEKEYQAQRNDTGIDLARIGGNVLGSILPTSKVGAAATTAGRIGQGAAIGAASGAANPVTGEDGFWSEKAMQTLLGGALGGLVPGAWEASKMVGRGVRNVVDPLLPGGSDRAAGRLASAVAGTKKDDVIAALVNADKNLTAGQAAVPSGSAEFAALQKLATETKPSPYLAKEAAQEAARQAELGTIGQTKDALKQAVSERGANAAKNYGEAYKAAIKADPELAQIASNPYFQKALPTALDLAKASKIDPKTDMTEFLHMVKIGIDKQLGATGETALARAEKDAALGAKQQLVDWMGKKNPAYESARSAFSAESKPINQMEVGQYLQDKLGSPLGNTERAASFAQAVRDAPGTIKRSTGQKMYDELGQVLEPKQVESVNKVLDSLKNDAEFKDMAAKGMSATRRATGEFSEPVRGVNIIDRAATIANAILKRLEGKGTKGTMNSLADAMQDPSKIGKLMQDAKPFERQAIIDELMKLQAAGIGQQP